MTRPGAENRPASCARKVPGPSPLGPEFTSAEQMQITYISEVRAYKAARGDINAFTYVGKKVRPGHETLPSHAEYKPKPDVWVKHALALLQQGRDPCDYVRKVFAALADRPEAVPIPSTLRSQHCEELYQEAKRQLREEIRLAFKAQVDLATGTIRALQNVCDVPMEQATTEILCDRGIELSALFRYCLAHSMGDKGSFPKIAARFRMAAAIQYIHNKSHYDVVWKKWIPKKFLATARRLYDAWIGQLTRECYGHQHKEEEDE